MNGLGLGGGMKRGSGRGRLLDFFTSSSPSPFCWCKTPGEGGRVFIFKSMTKIFEFGLNDLGKLKKKNSAEKLGSTPTLICRVHGVQAAAKPL